MRNQALTALILLAASAALSGCADSIAFTYRGEESAWKEARSEAREALLHKDYATAETKYAQAAEHARHLQSTNPHHYVETLFDLACTQEKAGETAKAKQTFQDMLAACDELDKYANTNTSELYRRVAILSRANAWLELGNIAKQEKDYAGAESCYKQGLQISSVRASNFPKVGTLKREYADLLEKEGKEPETAKRLRDEATQAGEGILEGL